MYRKVSTNWGEGSVAVVGNTIVITQGPNKVIVSSDELGNFVADVESASFPKPIKPVGIDGGMFPLKPNPHPNTPKPKSMDDILQDMIFIAHGWRPIHTK